MIQHHRVAWLVQQPAVHGGVLLGDRDEQDREHHTAQPVHLCMAIANPPAVMVFPDLVGEAKALQGCLCADAAIHWHPDALIVVKPDASGPAKEGQAYG